MRRRTRSLGERWRLGASMRRKALLLVASVVGASGAAAADVHSAEILPRGQISEAVQQGYADGVNACDGLGALDDPAFRQLHAKGCGEG